MGLRYNTELTMQPLAAEWHWQDYDKEERKQRIRIYLMDNICIMAQKLEKGDYDFFNLPKELRTEEGCRGYLHGYINLFNLLWYNV